MASPTADVVILGAGAHGASLAYHLARRGARVRVLERRHIAAGATGRSSGLIRMHYDLELEARLAWASHAVFSHFSDLLGGECGFVRTGFLQVVLEAQAPALRANTERLKALGIPTECMTGEEVARIAPMLSTADIFLAAYEPDSGYADPTLTTASYLRAAQRDGAIVEQGYEVTGLILSRGAVSGVRGVAGNVSAPIVVNAAGAWAGPLARSAGLDLPLETLRHDIAFLRRPPALEADHPCVIDDILSMYIRPETGGLTLVGLEDANPRGLPPDFEPRPPEDFVTRAVERVCVRMPGMERGSLHSTQGGFDGVTPDEHPLIGPAGPDGYFLDCGFSMMGLKIAPAVGECLARRILEGHWGPIDLSPFDPLRFARGEFLRGENPYGPGWR